LSQDISDKFETELCVGSESYIGIMSTDLPITSAVSSMWAQNDSQDQWKGALQLQPRTYLLSPEDAIEHLSFTYDGAQRIGLDLRFLGLVKCFWCRSKELCAC
jgi:hypothetical protein